MQTFGFLKMLKFCSVRNSYIVHLTPVLKIVFDYVRNDRLFGYFNFAFDAVLLPGAH